jgi:hypothetical protein
MDPTRVICVSCLETCNRSESKNNAQFAGAAANFVDKHGALGRKIAKNINVLIKEYLVLKYGGIPHQGTH